MGVCMPGSPSGCAQTYWSSHPAFLIPLQAGLESERTKKKNYSKAVCIFICLREGSAYKPTVAGQGVCAGVRAASPVSRIHHNYQHLLRNNEHQFISKMWVIQALISVLYAKSMWKNSNPYWSYLTWAVTWHRTRQYWEEIIESQMVWVRRAL